MVRSAGTYSVIRDREPKLTTQSARRSGLPKNVCVPAPSGMMAPLSDETNSASSSMDPGRTAFPGEIPSIVNAEPSEASRAKSLQLSFRFRRYSLWCAFRFPCSRAGWEIFWRDLEDHQD